MYPFSNLVHLLIKFLSVVDAIRYLLEVDLEFLGFRTVFQERKSLFDEFLDI